MAANKLHHICSHQKKHTNLHTKPIRCHNAQQHWRCRMATMDVCTYPYSNLLTFTHLATKIFSDMQFRPIHLCHNSLYLHIVSLACGEYVNMAGPATLSKILSAKLFPVAHNWSHPHHISVHISHITHFLPPHFILWSCYILCSLWDGMLYMCQRPTAK